MTVSPPGNKRWRFQPREEAEDGAEERRLIYGCERAG